MAQNQQKNCIKCLVNQADADSHVVPNSIRKHMYGEQKGRNKKFLFSYIGRPDLPSQDFPKPKLMCKGCDSKFGSDLEKDLPKLLMPRNVDDPKSWAKLCLTTLSHGPFKDYPPTVQPLLKRNAALIAWKVLHAVERDGNSPDLSCFLHSVDGQALDRAMLHFILQQPSPLPTVLLNQPVLWKIEPTTAAALTGNNDELPISWTVSYEKDKPETASIFAVFGLWIVGWQFPESTVTLNTALARWLIFLIDQGKTSFQAP